MLNRMCFFQPRGSGEDFPEAPVRTDWQTREDAESNFRGSLAYLRGWREYAQALPNEAPSEAYLQHAIDLYNAARLGTEGLIKSLQADPSLGADSRNETAAADLEVLSRIAWAYEQGAANFAQRRVETARSKTFAGTWERYVSYLTNELPERAREAVVAAKKAIEDVGGPGAVGLAIGAVAVLVALFAFRR